MTTEPQTSLPIADPAEVEKARAFFAQKAEVDAIVAEANTPIPTAFAERVEEVAAGVHGAPDLTAIDNLIAAARANLGGAFYDSGPARKGEHPSVEVSDPSMLNALAAERSVLDRQIKMLTERKASIDDLAKDLIGEDHDLKANGATVVTYRPSTSRVLDQEHIKKVFPDTAENAELWKDQSSRRINWT